MDRGQTAWFVHDATRVGPGVVSRLNPSSVIARFAIVSLGSNLGDSAGLIREAMERLEAFSRRPLWRSSLWRSRPVACPPGSPEFVNAVVLLSPGLAERPESLLKRLQELERAFGRTPKVVRNEPRPLDLDLIAFGPERRAGPQLTLPHPRAHRRRFVLAPLAELLPDLVLPGQSRSVTQLLGRLPDAGDVTRLGPAALPPTPEVDSAPTLRA